MALNGLLMVHQKALSELAQAALTDGEAPEGYSLVIDSNPPVWRKIKTEPVSAPVAEPTG